MTWKAGSLVFTVIGLTNAYLTKNELQLSFFQ